MLLHIFNAHASGLWDVTELLTVFLVNNYCMYIVMYVCLSRDPATCVSASCVPLSLDSFPVRMYVCCLNKTRRFLSMICKYNFRNKARI